MRGHFAYPRRSASAARASRDFGRAQDLGGLTQSRGSGDIRLRGKNPSALTMPTLSAATRASLSRSTAPRIRARTSWPAIKRARTSFVRKDIASFVSTTPKLTSRPIACSTPSCWRFSGAAHDRLRAFPTGPSPYLSPQAGRGAAGAGARSWVGPASGRRPPLMQMPQLIRVPHHIDRRHLPVLDLQRRRLELAIRLPRDEARQAVDEAEADEFRAMLPE